MPALAFATTHVLLAQSYAWQSLNYSGKRDICAKIDGAMMSQIIRVTIANGIITETQDLTFARMTDASRAEQARLGTQPYEGVCFDVHARYSQRVRLADLNPASEYVMPQVIQPMQAVYFSCKVANCVTASGEPYSMYLGPSRFGFVVRDGATLDAAIRDMKRLIQEAARTTTAATTSRQGQQGQQGQRSGPASAPATAAATERSPGAQADQLADQVAAGLQVVQALMDVFGKKKPAAPQPNSAAPSSARPSALDQRLEEAMKPVQSEVSKATASLRAGDYNDAEDRLARALVAVNRLSPDLRSDSRVADLERGIQNLLANVQSARDAEALVSGRRALQPAGDALAVAKSDLAKGDYGDAQVKLADALNTVRAAGPDVAQSAAALALLEEIRGAATEGRAACGAESRLAQARGRPALACAFAVLTLTGGLVSGTANAAGFEVIGGTRPPYASGIRPGDPMPGAASAYRVPSSFNDGLCVADRQTRWTTPVPVPRRNAALDNAPGIDLQYSVSIPSCASEQQQIRVVAKNKNAYRTGVLYIVRVFATKGGVFHDMAEGGAVLNPSVTSTPYYADPFSQDRGILEPSPIWIDWVEVRCVVEKQIDEQLAPGAYSRGMPALASYRECR